LAIKTVGVMSALLARVLRRLIDWRAIYIDPTLDTMHPRFSGRYVYVCWHESLLMPILLRGDRRMLALASHHRDGEIIAQAMDRLGWSVARGSSARGATGALLKLLRNDDRHPNLTPDGPRGPRHEFSAGAIFLASKLGLPIVCVGYGYDRPRRLDSWDKFAIPRLFSRGRAVFGPALYVPANLDRDTLDRYRAFFGRHLCWLTEEAERWAVSGEKRDAEMRMFVGRPSPEMVAYNGGPGYQWPEELAREWAALPGATEAVNRGTSNQAAA